MVRALLPDLLINDINSITTIASNALDDGQTSTLILSTACSDPTAPIDLQCASEYSLDSNIDASTTEFQPDEYAGIN